MLIRAAVFWVLAAAVAPVAAADALAPVVRVVAATPAAASTARELSGAAPLLVQQAAFRLRLSPPPEVLVVVAAEAPRSAEAAARLELSNVPYWSAGIAEPWRGRIVLFADRLGVADHDGIAGALVHEAAHLTLGAHLPRGVRVPRWYDEGLAMVVERDVSLRDAWELARLSLFSDPPPLASLARDWPVSSAGARSAYAQALSFVSYAEERAAPGAPRRLTEAMTAGLGFDRAFAVAYGADAATLEAGWRGALHQRYFIVPLILAGALANAAIGILALLAVIAARRRRARTLREWGEEELMLHGDHDDWRRDIN